MRYDKYFNFLGGSPLYMYVPRQIIKMAEALSERIMEVDLNIELSLTIRRTIKKCNAFLQRNV